MWFLSYGHIGHQRVGILGRDGIMHMRRRRISNGGAWGMMHVEREEVLLFGYSRVNISTEN